MQRIHQRRGAVKKWTLLAVIGAVAGIGIGGAIAQVVPSTGGVDINTLIQQFGSLFGNGTGTTTTGGTTTTPTTTQPSTGSSTRPPQIIENQFTTTSTPSIRERSPGTWVQVAMGVQSGAEGSMIVGGPGDEPDGFIKTTIDTLALDVINMITNLLSGLNLLTGAAGGFTPTGGTTTPDGIGTIPNSATTGAGTSVPIQ